MTRKVVPLLAAAWLALAAPSPAADYRAELDADAAPKLLASHFAPFGFQPAKAITRDGRHLKFKLPAAKGVGQTGVYSFFAAAGDFEFSATYQLLAFPQPKSGYGMSVGLGLDTEGPDGGVAFTRSHRAGEPPGYLVTRSTPGEGGMKYESKHYPATAKAGRLVVRREGSEAVFLAGEGKAEPQEVARLPFTLATVRKLRLFADPGDSATPLEVRVGNVVVRAEEITGAIPRRDQPFDWGWCLWPAVFVFGSASAAVLWRKRSAQAEDG